MPSRNSPRTNPAEPPSHDEAARITDLPPGGADAVRAQMPTLVDDVELEAARLESMRKSSIPAVQSAAVSGARPPDGEIDVIWAPESEPLEPEELFSKYVRLLGAFTRVPMVTVPFEKLPSISMDNRMGFLVALVDGTSSIQTLLDVASMPPREVLHGLVTLRDLGIVAFRDE